MTATLRLVVDALATFRLTKLVTHDTLTLEAREAVIAGAYRRAGRDEWAEEQMAAEGPRSWQEDVVPNDPDPPKLATLVTCPWCAGAWLALGVVVARRLFPRAWSAVAEVFALSAAAGLVAENWQRS